MAAAVESAISSHIAHLGVSNASIHCSVRLRRDCTTRGDWHTRNTHNLSQSRCFESCNRPPAARRPAFAVVVDDAPTPTAWHVFPQLPWPCLYVYVLHGEKS